MVTKEKIDFGISYAEKQIAKEKNPILFNLLKNISTNKKVKILDVGCGFGGHSMWYAQFDNCEVYGLDVDANHIEVAKKYDLDTCQMALAWCRTRPFMASAIFGARTNEQLSNALDSVNIVLTEECLRDIEKAHKQNPMPF